MKKQNSTRVQALKKTLSFIAVISFSLSTSAQKKWSLKDCVDHAMEQNISIKLAKLDIWSAEEDVVTARANFLPTLSASASQIYNFGSFIGQDGTRIKSDSRGNNFSLNTGVVLFNGFQNLNLYKQAQLGVQGSQLQLSILKDNISLNVVNAYLNVLFNKEALKISQEQLNVSQNQLEQTKDLVASGTRPLADLLEVKAAVAADNESLVNAQNNVDLSLLNLSQLLQLSPNGFDIEGVEISLYTASLIYNSTATIYDYALQNRSEIKSAELNIENADLAIDLARSAYYPTLSFGAGLGSSYQHRQGASDTRTEYNVDPNNPGQIIETIVPYGFQEQIDNNLGYNIGFSLNIPIFNGFRNDANVYKAVINKEKATLALEQEKQNLNTNINQAYADAKAALKQFQASTISVESQQQAYTNAFDKFNLGAATAFEMEQVRSRLVNAQATLLNAKYNFVFKTKVLDFYMGKPLIP